MKINKIAFHVKKEHRDLRLTDFSETNTDIIVKRLCENHKEYAAYDVMEFRRVVRESFQAVLAEDKEGGPVGSITHYGTGSTTTSNSVNTTGRLGSMIQQVMPLNQTLSSLYSTASKRSRPIEEQLESINNIMMGDEGPHRVEKLEGDTCLGIKGSMTPILKTSLDEVKSSNASDTGILSSRRPGFPKDDIKKTNKKLVGRKNKRGKHKHVDDDDDDDIDSEIESAIQVASTPLLDWF